MERVFREPAAGLPGLELRGFDLTGSDKPQDQAKGETDIQEKEDKQLYCFICGTAITRTSERISRQGSHEHTFANPAGYVFHIGCFRNAPGCSRAGEFTEMFSWFEGFSWRYALCGSCKIHLGWAYQDAEGNQFYGLILNRLLGSKEYFPSES